MSLASINTLKTIQRMSLGALFVASALIILFSFFGTQKADATAKVPQAPTVVFEETFENLVDPGTAIFINTYTGPAPTSMTYTADPAWIDGPECNGIIASFNSTSGTTLCPPNVFDDYIQPIAQLMGNTYGGGDDNHVLADVTATQAATPTPAPTLQTLTPVTLPGPNRFLAFSIEIGATSCAEAQPLLRFFLIDGGDIPVNTDPIDPCTGPTDATSPGSNGGIRVGRYSTDRASLFSGTQVGLKLTNDQTNPLGNDYVFDGLRLLDATPSLDKSFGSGSYAAGQNIPLTFTITNTSELGEKNGWTLTDNLAPGLKVSSNPAAQTTCANSNITAAPGSTSIQIQGDLAEGQPFCEVTVNITADNEGSYENGASHVSVTGLNPPGTVASVTVGDGLANTGANQFAAALVAFVLLATGAVTALLVRRKTSASA